MVRNDMNRALPVEEALQLRREADVLLERLRESREVTEARLEETGRRDPMRTVTGRSAIEDAIQRTRSMIQHMDELMDQMETELVDASSESSNA